MSQIVSFQLFASNAKCMPSCETFRVAALRVPATILVCIGRSRNPVCGGNSLIDQWPMQAMILPTSGVVARLERHYLSGLDEHWFMWCSRHVAKHSMLHRAQGLITLFEKVTGEQLAFTSTMQHNMIIVSTVGLSVHVVEGAC
eukprot:3802164-Amphidinium_carterae.2